MPVELHHAKPYRYPGNDALEDDTSRGRIEISKGIWCVKQCQCKNWQHNI